MTINTATRLIGSTVVAWDQESDGYVEGKLVKVFEDTEQASLEISKNTRVTVDLAFISEGIADEVIQEAETEIVRDIPDFSDDGDGDLELV